MLNLCVSIQKVILCCVIFLELILYLQINVNLLHFCGYLNKGKLNNNNLYFILILINGLLIVVK